MKRRILAGLLLVAFVAACQGVPESERVDNERASTQQSHYAAVQPIPFFDFSMPRDVMIQIYKAVNESRQTHSVVSSQGTGEILWDCPSIGFPLAADAQLTNPVQMVGNGSAGYTTIEQAEPNGLFSSENTDATWVLCVDPSGSINPVYTEQKITAFPFPVTVGADGRITQAGGSTVTINVESGAVGADPSPAPSGAP